MRMRPSHASAVHASVPCVHMRMRPSMRAHAPVRRVGRRVGSAGRRETAEGAEAETAETAAGRGRRAPWPRARERGGARAERGGAGRAAESAVHGREEATASAVPLPPADDDHAADDPDRSTHGRPHVDARAGCAMRRAGHGPDGSPPLAAVPAVLTGADAAAARHRPPHGRGYATANGGGGGGGDGGGGLPGGPGARLTPPAWSHPAGARARAGALLAALLLALLAAAALWPRDGRPARPALASAASRYNASRTRPAAFARRAAGGRVADEYDLLGTATTVTVVQPPRRGTPPAAALPAAAAPPAPTTAAWARLDFGGFAVRSSFRTPQDLFRARPTALNLCMSHPDWQGIRQATYGQGLPVLEVPGITSAAHAQLLLAALEKLPLRRLVVNGIPPGTVPFAYALKAQLPHVEVLFVYHGSPSQAFHEAESGVVNELIVAAQKGVVSRVGIVKNGLRAAFTAGLGVPTFELWNRPPAPLHLRDARHAVQRRVWRIGVFGTVTLVHKNVLTQVLALCGLPNVEIHVLRRPAVPYLDFCRAPIVEHGTYLPHDRFVRLLLAMDVNLYVSLTECFPMLVIESVSAGVPCLTSATSAVYALDPVLHDYLVVAELDSPDEITAKVQRVLDNYDALSLRLWSLAPAVHAKVDRQWRLFMENLPDGALPDVPPVDYRVPRPPQAAPGNARPTVAFVTYEAYPVTPYGGGAGVIINGLVVALLRRGHDVVVLAHMAPEQVAAYRAAHAAAAAALGYAGTLTVYGVDELLEGAAPAVAVAPSPNIFLHRSRKFARALALAYARTPFDLVECFDYAGVAYELLRARADPAAAPYLPPEVVVAVRVHGTLQLIDQAEDAAPTEERRLMYLMEQYGIVGADLVLAQTPVLRRYVSAAYGLHPNAVTLAPPPMDVILGYVDAAAAAAEAAGEIPTWPGSRTFLIYGRLQLVKGLETVVRAAVLLLQRLEREPGAEDAAAAPVRFRFLGVDQWDTEHDCLTSAYLRSLVPREHQDAFELLVDQPADRAALVRHAASVHAAIFASAFETFNLALHEVARLRVPIVLSRIPAFLEYFNATSGALLFSPNDAASLAQALHTALADREWAPRIRAAGYALQYDDATQPYALYDTGPDSAIAARRQRGAGTRLALLAEHIAERVRELA